MEDQSKDYFCYKCNLVFKAPHNGNPSSAIKCEKCKGDFVEELVDKEQHREENFENNTFNNQIPNQNFFNFPQMNQPNAIRGQNFRTSNRIFINGREIIPPGSNSQSNQYSGIPNMNRNNFSFSIVNGRPIFQESNFGSQFPNNPNSSFQNFPSIV